MRKYGFKSNLSNPGWREHAADVLEERYGVRSLFKIPAVHEGIVDALVERGGSGPVSKTNIDCANKIRNAMPNAKVNFEVPLGDHRFMDLMVSTDLGIVGIDLNPTASHNSDYSFVCYTHACREYNCDKHDKPIPEDYHQSRSLMAQSLGVDYIQFYSWDMDTINNWIGFHTIDPGMSMSGLMTDIIEPRTNEYIPNEIRIGDIDHGMLSNEKTLYYGSFDSKNTLHAISRFSMMEDRVWKWSMAIDSRLDIKSYAKSIINRFTDEYGCERIVFDLPCDKSFIERHVPIRHGIHRKSSTQAVSHMEQRI